MAVKELSSADFSEFITKEYAVVDFFATWCYPCKLFAPIMDKSSEKYDNSVAFAKVNVDKCEDIAIEYNVSSIPTVVFFKNGKESERVIGLRQADEFNAIIDKLIK